MRLQVIGAGPAYSDRPGDIGACYLVRHAGAAILLDLGQGAFAGVAAAVEPSSLLATLVTHLHADHFIDLVPLRHYLRYQFRPPRRARVIAPAALRRRLDDLHGDPRFCAEALDIEPLRAGSFAVGPFEVTAGRVTHDGDSYAFRVGVGDGRGLAYSGDVGQASDLRALVSPGDVLLVEVSFGTGPVPPGAQHLDADDVGDLAAATGPSRVLLTHLQMGFDRTATEEAVRRRFGGPVELVEPGFTTPI